MEQRGERGPRGDHGQTGDEGEAGQVGEPGKAGRKGKIGQRGRTGAEGVKGRRGPGNWLSYLMMGAATIVALAVFLEINGQRREADLRTIAANKRAIAAIRAETRIRRDQQCVFFERDAEAAVEAFRDERARLRRTQSYLASLSADELRMPLNRLIRQTVPELQAEIVQKWEEARATAAPPYCNRPGVGVPEPNLKLPEKPKF